ncbi:hypothetical protein BaRGS_00037145, partial [Batillaria attramentaria]
MTHVVPNPFHCSANGSKHSSTSRPMGIVDEGDGHGTPPLTVAVQQGQIDICRQLLEAGADVTAQEVQTLRTPLHYALYLKRLDIFTLLLG